MSGAVMLCTSSMSSQRNEECAQCVEHNGNCFATRHMKTLSGGQTVMLMFNKGEGGVILYITSQAFLFTQSQNLGFPRKKKETENHHTIFLLSLPVGYKNRTSKGIGESRTLSSKQEGKEF